MTTDLKTASVKTLLKIISTRRCGDTFECQDLAAQELVSMLDELSKHAKALLDTMSASESPDANYWVEGRWNAEPAYHLKQALRNFRKRKPK